MKIHYVLYEGQELTLIAFKNGIFSSESTQGKRFIILICKHMLQRLPVALAQEKAGNTSDSLLNEIRQIIYSLLKKYIAI